MKIIVFILILLITGCNKAVFDSERFSVQVKDVVTQVGIPDVSVELEYGCGTLFQLPEFLSDYDLRTCDGMFNPLPDLVTDAEGKATFSLPDNMPKERILNAMRFHITKVPLGYNAGDNWAIRSTAWLIPKSAPLGNADKVEIYLKSLEEIELTLNSYEDLGFSVVNAPNGDKYLIEPFYGKWRVVYYLSNGKNIFVCLNPATKDFKMFKEYYSEGEFFC